MMNVLKFLILIFIFTGCSEGSNDTQNQENPVLDLEEISATHLNANVENLSGAEFIGIEILDTMYTAEFLKRELIIFSRPLENKEVRLTNATTRIRVARTSLDENPNDEAAQRVYENALKQKENIEMSQHKVDSMQAELAKIGANSVDYYELLMLYTRKDELGNASPENYNVRIGSNGSILQAKLTKRNAGKRVNK